MRISKVLIPLLSLLSVPAYSASFLADGVDATTITNSTRFYDNMKGSKAWAYTNGHVLDDTWKLYQQNSQVLGALSHRVNLEGINGSSFNFYTEFSVAMSPVRNDSLTCWYQVAANAIQYWQSYYGVFAKNDVAYGYNYDKSLLTTFEGGQSLKVGTVLYDNFQDVASQYEGTPAFEWYIKGTPHSYQRLEGETPQGGVASDGGFFQEYFTSGAASVTSVARTNDAVISSLETAFALTKDANGQYVSQTAGQIAYMGVMTNANAGHTLTCYGFAVDENGKLVSVQIADSDDYLDVHGMPSGYTLVTRYVKEGDDGKLYLYKDAEYTIAHSDYYIDTIGYIKTPETLKSMYEQYRSADTALTWNGQLPQIWSSTFTPETTDELPTASTGWAVYVDAGGEEHTDYYASYYATSRKVQFDDYAVYADKAPVIDVQGEVMAAGLVFDAEDNSYTLRQHEQGGSVTLSGDVVQQGSARATLQNLDVLSKNLKVQSGELALTQGTTLTVSGGDSVIADGAKLSLSDDSRLVMQGATLALNTTADLALGGTLEVSANSQLKMASPDVAKLTLSQVKLGDGKSLQVYSVKMAEQPVLVENLTLAGAEGTLSTTHHAGYWQVNALQAPANSTLNLVNGSDSTITTLFRLGSADVEDAGNFSGTIRVSSTNAKTKRSASLIIGHETIAQNAVVNLAEAKSSTAVLSLGINADKVQIAGLDSNADLGDRTVLYSGDYHYKKEWNEASIQSQKERTVVVHTEGQHTFNGKVLGNLHVEKSGSGTQRFAGSSTAFTGATVKGGQLHIGDGSTKGVVISGYRGAQAEIAGAISTSNAGQLVNITGESEMQKAVISGSLIDVMENCTLRLEHVTLADTSCITDNPAVLEVHDVVVDVTLGVNATIAESAIEAESMLTITSSAIDTVNITGSSLTINLNGFGSFADYQYVSVLFSDGVNAATFDLSSESSLVVSAYNADTGQTAFTQDLSASSSDAGLLYFMANDLVVPEPTTTTLSLLALTALAARRRRS